jgi:hypothetical protein
MRIYSRIFCREVDEWEFVDVCREPRLWDRIFGTLEMSGAMGKAGIGLLLKDNDTGDYLEVMPLVLLFRILIRTLYRSACSR